MLTNQQCRVQSQSCARDAAAASCLFTHLQVIKSELVQYNTGLFAASSSAICLLRVVADEGTAYDVIAFAHCQKDCILAPTGSHQSFMVTHVPVHVHLVTQIACDC